MKRLIWTIAAIGFLFDTYELLMLALIVRPALASSVWTLLLFRCATFVGVSVEFVAAVAWLAELFPHAEERERIIGWTQACASLGGLLVSGMYYAIVTYADALPAVRGGHEPWRYMLISGLMPAIPLIVARPFLPESPIWVKQKQAGELRRPTVAEIFRPGFRTVTIVAAVMMTAGYAASFGANLQLPRIVPGRSEVQAMARMAREQTVGLVQMLQELGGLAGRVALAFLAVRVVSRRLLIRAFLVPGVVIM